ncbi:MAG: LamB/YcsF family protein [Candidatus Gastranaerophilales bacterium]|nr:LamB/YcsF family protein [Candidatus Gastranaerophilales bacterium]
MGNNKNIDFNCDVAQGFGVYQDGSEFELLDYVSSVNVSCGFHAGDPVTIKNTLLKCKDKHLALGAHIGFCDIQGFGYRPMDLNSDEIEALVIYQLGALASFAKSYSLEIEHVRPHGAMYKMAAENFEFSLAIANAIKKFDKWLTYYGFANENLDKVAAETDIIVAREVFADKYYNQDGEINWEQKDFTTPEITMNRIRTLNHSGQMKVTGGAFVPMNCDTIHFGYKNPTIIETIKKANEIITPTPCNYNKVVSSGWL